MESSPFKLNIGMSVLAISPTDRWRTAAARKIGTSYAAQEEANDSDVSVATYPATRAWSRLSKMRTIRFVAYLSMEMRAFTLGQSTARTRFGLFISLVYDSYSTGHYVVCGMSWINFMPGKTNPVEFSDETIRNTRKIRLCIM